jgi:hypothetical protein
VNNIQMQAIAILMISAAIVLTSVSNFNQGRQIAELKEQVAIIQSKDAK